ncbi:MAG: N-acetyltransferase family protein [Lysobacterales bacterium]
MLIGLMKELAQFEDYLDDFAVNEADLVQRGLCQSPQFDIQVAHTADGTLFGMAVYYTVPYTYDLRPDMVLKELFVTREARGAGVGEALMDAVCCEARKLGCKRLRWLVMRSNQRAKGFYSRLGATEDAKWDNWRLAL